MARPVRSSQPSQPGRPARVLLGPLVAIGAIVILAIVALPGAGPTPASGTQPTGTVCGRPDLAPMVVKRSRWIPLKGVGLAP